MLRSHLLLSVLVALGATVSGCKTSDDSATTVKETVDAPAPVPMPDALTCKVTSIVGDDGEITTPNEPLTYTLKDLNRAPKYDGDNGGVRNDDEEHVVVDFGVVAHGGDQYATFYFKKADVAAYASGAKPSLPGTFEVGFEYDRLYLSTHVLECTK